MRRARVTITLSTDLLAKVDRAARSTPGASRSSVVESWLSSAARQRAERDLNRQIAEYYDNLDRESQSEAAEWARFSTQAFMVREDRSAYEPRARAKKPRRRPG